MVVGKEGNYLKSGQAPNYSVCGPNTVVTELVKAPLGESRADFKTFHAVFNVVLRLAAIPVVFVK